MRWRVFFEIHSEMLKLKKLSEGEVPSLTNLIKGLLYSLKVFILLSEFTNCRPKPLRAIRFSGEETESLNTCYNKVLILGTELNIALEWVILY